MRVFMPPAGGAPHPPASRGPPSPARGRGSIGWAFLTFLALLISAAPARAQEPTDDQLLQHFDAVAFGREYAGAPIGFVSKWKRQIGRASCRERMCQYV